jgi:hypothetical protein
MEKLVYVHFWGDEGDCGTAHIAFEYESKDAFVFDLLERTKDHKWETFNVGTRFESYSRVKVFEEADVWLDKSEVESVEHNLYTLDEWFERQKTKV